MVIVIMQVLENNDDNKEKNEIWQEQMEELQGKQLIDFAVKTINQDKLSEIDLEKLLSELEYFVYELGGKDIEISDIERLRNTINDSGKDISNIFSTFVSFLSSYEGNKNIQIGDIKRLKDAIDNIYSHCDNNYILQSVLEDLSYCLEEDNMSKIDLGTLKKVIKMSIEKLRIAIKEGNTRDINYNYIDRDLYGIFSRMSKENKRKAIDENRECWNFEEMLDCINYGLLHFTSGWDSEGIEMFEDSEMDTCLDIMYKYGERINKDWSCCTKEYKDRFIRRNGK